MNLSEILKEPNLINVSLKNNSIYFLDQPLKFDKSLIINGENTTLNLASQENLSFFLTFENKSQAFFTGIYFIFQGSNINQMIALIIVQNLSEIHFQVNFFFHKF